MKGYAIVFNEVLFKTSLKKIHLFLKKTLYICRVMNNIETDSKLQISEFLLQIKAIKLNVENVQFIKTEIEKYKNRIDNIINLCEKQI